MHRAQPAAAPTSPVVSLDDLIDRSVYGPGDDEIGRIAKVYADLADGRLRYALVEVGAFVAGLVARHVLVPFERFVWRDGRLFLPVAPEVLDGAPEWDRADVLDERYRAEVATYWSAVP